jgi:hypothetical protein
MFHELELSSATWSPWFAGKATLLPISDGKRGIPEKVAPETFGYPMLVVLSTAIGVRRDGVI